MMLDQVRNLSHQMRLFGIHEACERQAQIALSQQLHPLAACGESRARSGGSWCCEIDRNNDS